MPLARLGYSGIVFRREAGALAPLRQGRREFISAITALGFGAAATSGVVRMSSAFAQVPTNVVPGMIDVHHHHVPPFYVAENLERITVSGGGQINPACVVR